MTALLRTDVGRLRIVSLLEGTSYLLLLFVAMPLKYLAHEPGFTRVMGRVHGGLFVLFVIALAQAAMSLPFKRIAFAFVASMIPFGAFVFERSMRSEEAAAVVGA